MSSHPSNCPACLICSGPMVSTSWTGTRTIASCTRDQCLTYTACFHSTWVNNKCVILSYRCSSTIPVP